MIIRLTRNISQTLNTQMEEKKQQMAEALAEALQTDAASLLMRDPTDEDAVWYIWEQAKPGERRMIVDIAKTVTKTGT